MRTTLGRLQRISGVFVSDAAAVYGGSRQLLPLSAAQLDRLNLKRLWVSKDTVPARIQPLLTELRTQRCVHSWRQNLPSEGIVDQAVVRRVLDAQQQHRPTTTFVYWGEGMLGQEVSVAVATVSDAVTADFRFKGYPVLARCYIAEAFRGKGLYRPILRHRYEYCWQTWGDALNAIHLGSTEPAVWRVAMMSPDFDPGFRHIGGEDLKVAGDRFQVADLAAFTPNWTARALSELKALGDASEILALRQALSDLVTDGLPAMGVVRMGQLVNNASSALGVDVRSRSEALDGVMALAEAIPVVR